MSKHTKGPWMLGKPYGHTRVEIVGNEGNRMVASVVDTRAKYNPATDKNEQVQCPEGEANARLIAAAPDLLEALENALAYVDDACHFPEQFKRGVVVGHAKQVRAALAKATGESWPMPGKGWLK